MERMARLFKALADPTRLRILNLLLESPFCVCEMEGILGLPQPLLSRHLAYLRNGGLVTSNRDGMRVNYALNPEDALVKGLRPLLVEELTKDPVGRADLRKANFVVRNRRKERENSR